MQRHLTTRESLRALLETRPGLTPADAAHALGIDRTTARYHLRRLVEAGAAVTGGPDAPTRHFLPGAVPPAQRGVYALACDASDLLDALRGAPGATQSELARRLGVPRPTLAARLARLRESGLVRAERSGREVRLHVADVGALPFPRPGRAA